MKKPRPRLLALRTGALGDVCLLLPVIRALADFAGVDWLIGPPCAAAVRRFPQVSCNLLETTTDPREPTPFPDALLGQLKRQNYDYCLDFSHGPEATALVARLPEIPVRAVTDDPAQDALLGFNPAGLDLRAPFNRLIPVEPALHQVEKGRLLVEQACGFPLRLAWPLPERPRPGRELRIFVQVHAAKKSKRWPVRHFAAVLRSLRRRGPIRCLVNAQPERYAARLRWALAFSGINLECVSFDPTFRLLQDCLESVDFALGCDSGPMHFAALLGVPTVVVYGPFPASEFRPIARTISVSSSVPGLPAAAVSPASVRAAAHRMVDRLIAGSPWSDNVI